MIYKKIANTIKDDILNGKYQENEKLPSEFNLAEQYFTTKMTIRKSLALLAKNGFVYSIPKSGHYVASLIDIKSFNNLNAGSTYMLNKDAEIKTRVINFYECEARGFLAKKFKINKEDTVYCITRIRYVDDEPYTSEMVFMPKYLFEDLTEDIASKSIYAYVKSKGYELFTNRKNICAGIVPQKISDVEPKLKNKMVLQVENTGMLKNGIIFEYSLSYQMNQEVSIITHYEDLLS